MLAFWYGVLPLAVGLLGKLPGWALGGGEDLPPGVARDWAAWGRSPGFLRDSAAREGWTGFAALRAPLLAHAIVGDLYAPPRAVERFVELYPNARSEVRRLDPSSPGLAGLAHFSIFRSRYAAVWDGMRDWLLAAAANER
jgi:predicted alpha/beta hydrolase